MKRALLGLLLGLGLLLSLGFFLPGAVHLERQTQIQAPVCSVFAQLDDPKRFLLWSSMASFDPDGASITYAGPARGTGSRMSWFSSHRQVGGGSLEIVAAEPFLEVRTQVHREAKEQANNLFRLAPATEGGTTIIWELDLALEGGFLQRFGNPLLERKQGQDLTASLLRLKALAEALPQEDWCAYDLAILDLSAKVTASTPGRSGHRSEEISAALGQAFSAARAFLQEHDLVPAGPPFAINEEYGADGYRFQAGFPLAEDPALGNTGLGDNGLGNHGFGDRGKATVTVQTMPPTRAVRLIHIGPYSAMTGSYHALVAFLAARGLESTGPSWEEYVSDPSDTPENELLTHIFIPIQNHDRGP